MEPPTDAPVYEVYAWGHGYLGARPDLEGARRLADRYEGVRIVRQERDSFQVVLETGRMRRSRLCP